VQKSRTSYPTGAGTICGTGNVLANVITGNSANNVLDGGAGADTLIGGAGNDTYVVDNAGDVVTEVASGGRYGPGCRDLHPGC
jgi:Ca2+-binding RTX toxin-like protein